MRWPFSMFTRGSRPGPAGPDGADPASPDAATDPGAGDAGAADSTAPAGAAAAWRSLPAVQRSAGPAPLTAPALPFARGLAGRHGPEPTLAPLAHDVAADGTAGLVGGLAVPLVQRAPATAVGASDRDSVAATLPVSSGSHAGGHRAAPARGSAGETVAALPPRPAGDAAAPVLPPAAPPRTLPAVEPPEIALDATHVAPVSSPEPVRAFAPTVGADAPGADALGAGAAATPVASGADDAGAFGSPVVASVAPPATATAEAAERVLPSVPVGRRTLGETRRLGLGAPLASRPALQRVAEEGPSLPLAGSGPSSRGHIPAAPASSPTALVIPAAGAAAPLPVLRLAAESSAAAGPGGPAAGSDASAPGTAAPGAGSRAGVPLASHANRRPGDAARAGSPLAPAGASGLDEAPAGTSAPPSLPPPTGSLSLAQRSSLVDSEVAPGFADDPFGTTGDTGSAARTGDDEPARADWSTVPAGDGMPAAPASAGAADAGGPAAIGLVHPLAGAGPSVQRLATLPLTVGGIGAAGRTSPAAEPALAMVGGRPGGAEARSAVSSGVLPTAPAAAGPSRVGVPPAGLAVSYGGQPRSAGSSGAGVVASAARSAVHAGAGAMPVVARRSADATEDAASGWRGGAFAGTPSGSGWSGGFGAPGTSADSSPAPAMVQRSVTIDEMTATAQAPASRAGGPGAESAIAGSGGNQDIDALADRLYPKVRDRLTLDLLLDRERAGLLGDW